MGTAANRPNIALIRARETATGRIAETLLQGNTRTNPILDNIALRRIGTIEDCAKVIEFLATDLSDYVTGALIPVDGGLRAG